MAVISREELFSSPVITGLISELDTPDSYLQRFFNLKPGSANATKIDGNLAAWDLFHGTRSLPSISAPYAPPSLRSRKPYASRMAKCVRVHEKMLIKDADLERHRAAGTPIGSVDEGGMAFVKQQAGFHKQIFLNMREWALSRMFRGGFGFKVASNGFDLAPCEKDDGSVVEQIDSGIPSAHTGNIGGIIAASWATAGTDVITQLMNLEKYAARANGRPPRHFFLNGTTAANLFNNTQLSAVRGTANRIFDSLTQRPVDTSKGLPAGGGYDIVFGAIPLYTFHVYNGGAAVYGTGESFSAQIDSSNFQYFIPDEKVIITPEPSPEWIGMIEGSELYRESVVSEAKKSSGLTTWSTPTIDPAGVETKILDLFMPIIKEPYACYYADVIF